MSVKRIFRGLTPLSLSARNAIHDALPKEYKILATLMQDWAQICANPHLAKNILPTKLKKDGTLVIGAKNSSSLSELHYLKSQILDRIKRYIASSVVKDIKFVFTPSFFYEETGSLTPLKIKDNKVFAECLAATSSLEDLDLQEKLATLLYSIRTK
jgi:hypothetical protein